MGNSFVDLKQDDARNVLAMQARSVLLERSDRFFTEQKKTGKLDAAALRCKEDLDGIIEETIKSFKLGGRDMALKDMLSYEFGDHAVRSKGYSIACKRFANEMFAQLRSYFDASDRILSPIGLDTERISSVISTRERPAISPKSVEDALSPLASSWRISILRLLIEEDDGLAELGRKLGLKKGHAQFHIRALVGSGYISYDRKSRLYSITAKGCEAFTGIMTLVQRLESL